MLTFSAWSCLFEQEEKSFEKKAQVHLLVCFECNFLPLLLGMVCTEFGVRMAAREERLLSSSKHTLYVCFALVILLLVNFSIVVQLLGVRMRQVQAHFVAFASGDSWTKITNRNQLTKSEEGPTFRNTSDGTEQQVILIVGTFARTGSTFIGELFEFNPSAFTYLFEPLHYLDYEMCKYCLFARHLEDDDQADISSSSLEDNPQSPGGHTNISAKQRVMEYWWGELFKGRFDALVEHKPTLDWIQRKGFDPNGMSSSWSFRYP